MDIGAADCEYALTFDPRKAWAIDLLGAVLLHLNSLAGIAQGLGTLQKPFMLETFPDFEKVSIFKQVRCCGHLQGFGKCCRQATGGRCPI